MYMHPRTINCYCGDLPTGSAVVLLPIEVLSNDDHNVVTWDIYPHPGEVITQYEAVTGPVADGDRSVGLGDDRVPIASSNPTEAQLSSPFLINEPFSRPTWWCRPGSY